MADQKVRTPQAEETMTEPMSREQLEEINITTGHDPNIYTVARAALAGASAVETTDVSGAVEVGKESLRALIAERDTLRAQLNAAEAAAGRGGYGRAQPSTRSSFFMGGGS